MTKKIFHIAILVIMVVSTMGFTITKHYCGGGLIDLSIAGEVENCCDMEDGCCHNEQQTYQLEEDYTAPAVFNQIDYFTFVIFEIPEFLVKSREITIASISNNFGESPPPHDVLHFLADIQVYRL
tara:strand:- start:9359 stop:9733 length:375 start_codon:yes stop_codon:yes gene_type:complete